MAFWKGNKHPKELRVIKTARDEKSINEAARNGFKPLIIKVEPSNKIYSKYSIIQSKKTGEIKVIGDIRLRQYHLREKDFKIVVDWTHYYPYKFESPFAAYLIPSDIKRGEMVFIEDLIEDYIGTTWNQGDTYRLESCEAIWIRSKLKILYDPHKHQAEIIG